MEVIASFAVPSVVNPAGPPYCCSVLPPITSLQNPRVKQVVRLRNRRDREREGVFVIEGEREVNRALAAGAEVVEAFVCPDRLREAVDLPDNPYEVSAEVMAKMSYRDPPTGVLVVCRTPEHSLDDVKVTPFSVLLVAVGTEKPGNLGAMVRTAATAGCAAVIAAGPDVDIYNPNAIRNSTGAIFSTPTVAAPERDVLRWLREQNVPLVATVVEGGKPLWTAELPPSGPLAIVIGPEHAGLDATWTDAAEYRVTIPSATGAIDSLNSSNAAAVLLFEVARRRSLG